MQTSIYLLFSFLITLVTSAPIAEPEPEPKPEPESESIEILKRHNDNILIDPFTLSNQDLFDEIKRISEFSGAAYCISTIHGVKPGQLNEACSDISCADAEKDIYVVDVVDSLSHALIMTENSTKQIIIAFQGSSTFMDWVLDFTALPVDFESYGSTKNLDVYSIDAEADDPKVHMGFKKASENFFNHSLTALQQLKAKYPDYQFVVTGHSLGGALASLVGVELYMMGYNPAIVSLAGPKVFSKTFANWVDQKFATDSYVTSLQEQSVSTINPGTYTRITHVGDIVPCVPLVEMGYKHAGSEFYIDESDFPQNMLNVTIRGQYHERYELETLGGLAKKAVTDLKGLLKDYIVVAPHLYYLITMSTCSGLLQLIGLA
ncbi:unnamed protein product [Ambrosiozyma monospora]|uniref:triacylglycerol lipase n=1 Tax=Ambrosiozyma monospora TaxID=43982 RepID=A0A9W6YYM8_AMBMO|nr:unnamed protein product [Ambrosiozyma monospora]